MINQSFVKNKKILGVRPHDVHIWIWGVYVTFVSAALSGWTGMLGGASTDAQLASSQSSGWTTQGRPQLAESWELMSARRWSFFSATEKQTPPPPPVLLQ